MRGLSFLPSEALAKSRVHSATVSACGSAETNPLIHRRSPDGGEGMGPGSRQGFECMRDGREAT